MNTFANAIDALEESRAGLSISAIAENPQKIQIETVQQREDVIVKISDNGLGMTEKIRSQILQQGFTTKKVGKGTGLGLAISREIVEEVHQGKLSVDSSPGQGTTFIIKLHSHSKMI